MNSCIPGVFTDNHHCSLTGKIHRRLRHKRRKNKYKNLNTRQKRKIFGMSCLKSKTKKFQNSDQPLPHYKDFNVPNFRSMKYHWYWSNYRKAFDWHNKHTTAQWKNCALVLQEENKFLMEIIQNHLPNLSLNTPVTNQNLNNFIESAQEKVVPNHLSYRFKNGSQNNVESINENIYNNEQLKDHYYENAIECYGDSHVVEVEDSEEEIEFEMSEEMIKFFEQSFKHKLSLKKEKEKLAEKIDIDNEVDEIHLKRIKRSSEMKLLYGDDASKIIGMETAVQLSFDRYCDLKSPIYWPNIPLKL